MTTNSCAFRDFILATTAEDGDELIERFDNDPLGVGAEYGLTKEQVVILVQGDQGKIKAELQREGCGGSFKWSPFGLMTI